jgi:hypothetical protein
MPVSLISTGVQFPDNSIQTTAAAGLPIRSWQALTLANNTTYTNSFGLEIVVAAGSNYNGAFGWTDTCLVNGLTIVQNSYDSQFAAGGYIFQVPAGATYRVQFGTGVAYSRVLR